MGGDSSYYYFGAGPEGYLYPQSNLKSWGHHSIITGQFQSYPLAGFRYTPPNGTVESTGNGTYDDYRALAELYAATGGSSWIIQTGWMDGDKPCGSETNLAWQGTICRPVSAEPVCAAGAACGVCLHPIAYPANECPTNAELSTYLNCEFALVGDLCEADGECGTTDSLNNCGNSYDVYRKVALPEAEERVLGLYMPSNNLTGLLPAHLALATHLQVIELGGNKISGTLPTELALLTSLSTLDLSNNHLVGTLPPTLFSASTWRTVSVRGAVVGGSLSGCGDGIVSHGRTDCNPPSIVLSGNSLSGSLPSELGSIRSSEVTFYCGDGSIAAASPSTDGIDYCANTQLCPCGPCCYCSCSVPRDLQVLALHRNRISGSLPTQLGAIELALVPTPEQPDVFSLGRSPSRLSGHLHDISFGYNRLSGSVPIELGNLTALKELRMPNNHLSGTLPDAIRVNGSWIAAGTQVDYGVRGAGVGNLAELGNSRLRTLDLDNNHLSGSVPESLAECFALVALHNSFVRNLLDGPDQYHWNGHIGAQQRFHPLTQDGTTHEGSNIPVVQRLRQFRVGLAAIDGPLTGPSFTTHESRDACMWSPNVLFRCDRPGFEVGHGGGQSFVRTGGLRRCQDALINTELAGTDVEIPLSLEYNHRPLDPNRYPNSSLGRVL